MYKEIDGDLIKLAKQKHFDIIAHGCNCFCTMGSGIAKTVKEEFPNAYLADLRTVNGDINKLGNYSEAKIENLQLTILNCYTQYGYNTSEKPFDYEAFTLCMRKINQKFSTYKIGLPLIGSYRAGGDWNMIKEIIKKELTRMDVTIVKFNENEQKNKTA